MMDSGMSQAKAALKVGMARKTARKYLSERKLPSELMQPRTYRTRADPFDEVWPDVEALLRADPALESKTLFDWLQRECPGTFADGQLRTLQRRVKVWRAMDGRAKEVFFDQVHHAGHPPRTGAFVCREARPVLDSPLSGSRSRRVAAG